MARDCNIQKELLELRATLSDHFGGPVDCPLLKEAETAYKVYDQAMSTKNQDQATLALERLCQATGVLHSELADGDKPGTSHCINIVNFIHPEKPVLRPVTLSWV